MKQIAKAFAAIALLLTANSTNAQQPDWIELASVVEQAFDESTPDLSKRIYLYQRCAAQQLAMSTIVAEADADLVKSFTESAMYLSQAATLDKASLAAQRTEENPDLSNLSKTTLETVKQLYELYMKWVNNNYLLNGSYFENDEILQTEIAICNSASELAQLTINLMSEESN
jgi:hypothetical protein